MSSRAKRANRGKARTVPLPTKVESLKMLREAGADESLLAHCKAVSALAVKIAKKCKVPVDLQLVEIGGLLHDIGRTSTHGVAHGVEGGKIARKKGLSIKILRIIERHIGAGLSKEDAERLGLPKRSYLPMTMEEKIIAHADNLISGNKRAPVAEAVTRLVRLRENEGAGRIVALHKELSELCGVDLDLL